MTALPKWLIFFGAVLVLLGVLLWIGTKFGISFGKLPGDFHLVKEKFSFHFPLATSILLSIVLTLFINLFLWFISRK